MKSDTRKIINSMLALAMTTAVFSGCSRKVEDVELPSKPEVVTSAPTNSEPPVTTTSEPPVTTSDPLVTSEPISSSPEPEESTPYVPEPEPEIATSNSDDPNCPPGFVVKQGAGGSLYYDPNEPGYSGGVGKFQFVGRLDEDGEHVWGFQGRAPGNLGTEPIPYYLYQSGDSITDPYDGTVMPVPSDLVGRADTSANRANVRGDYINHHDDYNGLGISEEEMDSILGW